MDLLIFLKINQDSNLKMIEFTFDFYCIIKNKIKNPNQEVKLNVIK